MSTLDILCGPVVGPATRTTKGDQCQTRVAHPRGWHTATDVVRGGPGGPGASVYSEV